MEQPTTSYTMNNVIVFSLWALVAAIPCQDRGLQTHFSMPRNFVWDGPLISIYDNVVEESKKRDLRSSGSPSKFWFFGSRVDNMLFLL